MEPDANIVICCIPFTYKKKQYIRELISFATMPKRNPKIMRASQKEMSMMFFLRSKYYGGLARAGNFLTSLSFLNIFLSVLQIPQVPGLCVR